MAKGLFTQGVSLLTNGRTTLDEVRAALRRQGLDVVKESPAQDHWAFGGPTLIVAFRPEVNGYAAVDLVSQPWPDAMGDPKTDAMTFGAWSMGQFGPFAFPGSLARARQHPTGHTSAAALHCKVVWRGFTMRTAFLVATISFAIISLGGFSTAGGGPKDGSVELDVPYADGGDQQKLDLYLPAKKGFATIVFTYGGGWHTGSRKSVAVVGEKLQSFGYGCALLSHRLSPKDKFPAQIEDVAAGFAWVKGHIADKGGDPKQVFLIGHSSGAHLSLLLAADPKYLAKHKLAPGDIAGVVGLSPPVDLEPRKDGKGFGDALMAGHGADVFARDPAVMRDASPIRHLSRNLPPVLLIVGERDFPMLEADAKAFVERAREQKATADSFVTKGRDHMGVVRALLDERSDVLERVQSFLSKPKE
jgi:acetyl esterase/lipase